MLNSKNLINTALLSFFCTLSFAASDIVPADADRVLIDCTIQPVFRAGSSPVGNALALAIANNDALHSEPYTNNAFQKFGFVYSGQQQQLAYETPRGNIYHTFNKWRIISQQYYLCMRTVAVRSDLFNIRLATCNADLDNNTWGFRDFLLNYRDYPNSRDIRIRSGNWTHQYLSMPKTDYGSIDVAKHFNGGTSIDFNIDFEISGCKNRNGTAGANPMNYSRPIS